MLTPIDNTIQFRYTGTSDSLLVQDHRHSNSSQYLYTTAAYVLPQEVNMNTPLVSNISGLDYCK